MSFQVRLFALLFSSLFFACSPATATSITISFESFPGLDGVLGTADDIAALPGVRILGDEFTSLGLTFTQAALLKDNFFDGDANNHFLSNTSIDGTFAIPVFGIAIQSKSFWSVTLTAFGASGNVIATSQLLNPSRGATFVTGELAVTTLEPIVRFTIAPPEVSDIINLDNMVVSVSAVPEPSQIALFMVGVLVLVGNRRRQR